MRGSRFSKHELINFVLKFKDENGRFPEKRDFLNNYSFPSFSQYIREWGSWGRALMIITGRTTSKEKKKLNKLKCIHCGESFEAYVIRRKFCSKECEMSFKALGNIPRGYRLKAFKSYPWECEICGYNECTNYLSGKSYAYLPSILDVHHIDGNRRNNDYFNLSILCPTCHAKVERGIIRNLNRGKLFLKLTWEVVSVEEFLDLSYMTYNHKKRSKRRMDVVDEQ